MTQSTEPIRVTFVDFWEGFDPNIFFLPIISAAAKLHPVREASPDEACLIVECFFPPQPSKIKRLANYLMPRREYKPAVRKSVTPRIWFTGENVRPPMEDFEHFFSFDVDDLFGVNTYLPLIYLGVNWFHTTPKAPSPEVDRMGIFPTLDFLDSRRTDTENQRKGFACAFIGNPEPIRMRTVEKLQTIGQVDVFGPSVGRPVKNKVDIARNYKFMMCFENDIYPGYVTEKPLDAWTSGCIPIWRGIDSASILNADSIINADNFSNLQNLISHVGDVHSSKSEFSRMQQEVLVTKNFSIEKIKDSFEAILKQTLESTCSGHGHSL
jgi:hypothetical protein